MYSYSYISRQGLVTPRMLSYLSSMMSPRMLGFNVQFIQTTMPVVSLSECNLPVPLTALTAQSLNAVQK